jgi:hypothetical protein
MILSNGNWLAREVRVGYIAGSQGTLTVAGGDHLISSNLTVGLYDGAIGGRILWLRRVHPRRRHRERR